MHPSPGFSYPPSQQEDPIDSPIINLPSIHHHKKQPSTSHQPSSHLQPFIKTLYCQPCFKRGKINEPVYVNLNEFQNNRYICEGCSVGQTYIIELDQKFRKQMKNNRRNVKMESSINARERQRDWQGLFQIKVGQENHAKNIIAHQEDEQNISQIPSQTSSSSPLPPPTPDFMKNLQINHNDYTKYSIQDIGNYTQNITKQYQDACQAIDRYEKTITQNIIQWRNIVRIQFQGVIGTFGNGRVGEFFYMLKELEILWGEVKDVEEKMTNLQNDTSINNNKQLTSAAIKSQQPSQIKSLQQLHQSALCQYNKQKQKVELFVQILKMSGIRNLSHLGSLYTSCKGFSDAVQILVDLQQKQTHRRFDFIINKFKLCSIDALYDADMINIGQLDNRIEKPPVFDEVVVGYNSYGSNDRKRKVQLNENGIRRKAKKQSKRRVAQELNNVKSHFQQSSLSSSLNKAKQSQKQTEISLISEQSQIQENSSQQQQQHQQESPRLQQYKLEVTNAILQQQAEKFQKIKFMKLKSKKPFQSALLNMNKIARDQVNQFWEKEKEKQKDKQNNQTVQIDLQKLELDLSDSSGTHLSQQQPTPYPSMKQYYSYQKNRNIFKSKLQLTPQNYHQFPPPQVYLPSVQSLTLKYSPPSVEGWKFLQSIKNTFRRLIQLIIEDPQLARKDTIIMIAEYFPKLKSLVIRCENQFDWELGKLFERKMTRLVRFQVNDGKGQSEQQIEQDNSRE